MDPSLHEVLSKHFTTLTQPSSSLSEVGAMVMWQYQLSEPFPLSWSALDSTSLVMYVYAVGFDFIRLADAVRVAEPWGRLRQDSPNEEWFFEWLSQDPQVIGIQGVRSVMQMELAVSLEPIEKLLKGCSFPKPDLAIARAIRAYYRRWLENNGVIGQAIKPYHTGFFAWLEEESEVWR